MPRTLSVPPARSAVRAACSACSATSVAFVALAVLIAAPATGQTVAATFEELRFKVKAGDTVYLTTEGGTSEQRARILELSGSSLAVSIDGVRRDLVESNVTRIRQRLPDSKVNGAVIGFLVVAGFSTSMAKAFESPAGACSVGCISVNVLYGGGLGALMGLGIDALIQGRKDIFQRGASRSSLDVALRPSLTAQAKSLNVSVRF